MEYKNDRLGVAFTLPDKITVRQQLQYDSTRDGPALFDLQTSMYERLWNAAKTLIQDWQCETVSLDTDLGDAASSKAARVIEWAGRAVFSHMLKLDTPEKNS